MTNTTKLINDNCLSNVLYQSEYSLAADFKYTIVQTSNIWMSFFICLVLFNIGTVIICLMKKTKKNSSEKNSILIDEKFNYIKETNKKLEYKNRELDELLKKQESENSNLVKTIENLNRTVYEIEKKLNEIDENTTSQIILEDSLKEPDKLSNLDVPLIKLVYANNINNNGSFDEKYFDNQPTSDVYYKIEIQDSNASFEFYNTHKSLNIALNYYDDYIKPFCDNLNAFKPNARHIKTITPGTLIKEGNIWEVQTKAKINYE